MNVSSICLAILFCGDMTGYDIRKISTEGSFCFFVEASYGSIYPALTRLEHEGLVTCRHEAQNGKPARKVYSITESGRQMFLKEMLQPHKEDIYRSEFLLLSIYASLLGPDVVQSAIDRQIELLEQEQQLINACDGPISGATAEDAPKDVNQVLVEQAGNWARSYGNYCVSAGIDYLKKHGVELVEIARKGQSTVES
ncbi:DNA-binding transcriptional regulator, PadR family [Cohaesibacter sp. ES.047]|uniref:PadR family transcriptional regulator n=1 Tax=Cohaesibacter sp. ES.047 TaxID=1798205 RepID=UPI000BB7EB7E|nr:PadR family transcriptional regulator [Cohaesibacter sp. ES.047]SNY93051.1 DNA-binding transcriptional regulator, PadR family [Cohaesibacter sp. ES.047]